VTVLAWHIHAGLGSGGVRGIERSQAVLEAHPADVVLLFSADKGTRRAKQVDQAGELGEAVGRESFFRESLPWEGGSYGDAILYPAKHKMIKELLLPDVQEEEPRYLRDHLITLPEWPGPLGIGMAHLSHASQNRPGQANAVNAHYRELQGQPTVLAVNTYGKVGTPEHFNLSVAWEEVGDPEKQPKFPAKKPHTAYLHLFVRPFDAWQVISTKVLPNSDASQSRPLLVELEYLGSKADR